ncbi:MAG: AAA family ATPase [Pseudomonadota bacterium]
MYTQFFGLTEKPFSITPDPHFLFLSERHAEALAHLVYGVTESGGFIQLTGEVGTGKTTLTRSLLERLPDAVDLAAILNPRLTVPEFLEAILDELGIAHPEERSTRALVDALNTHLLAAHEQGRKTVLLVDEAQNLDADVLEQLRLLTNLETSKQKLLQIILVGQPELRTLLARNDLRQLAQRITGRYHLESLNSKETIAYVRHRMAIAGATTDVFTPGALWEVHRVSQGIPRVVNVVCDRALLGAFSIESHEVTRDVVKRAAAEVRGTVPASTPRVLTPTSWWASVAGLAAVGVAIWGIATLMSKPDSGTAEAKVTLDPAIVTTPAPTEVVALPLPAPGDKPPEPELELGDEPTNSEVSGQKDEPRPSLGDILTRPGVDTGTDTAFAQLFELWETEPADDVAPCVSARRAGLRCAYQVGSLRLLRTLNRPAILSLVDDDGRAHNALLTRVQDRKMTLRFGSDVFEVDSVDVAELWLGEFLVLWRPLHGDTDLLLPGSNDPAVGWLRDELAAIQSVSDTTKRPEVFDSRLQRRLEAFQRSRRLEADGKAGVQTLIAINSAQQRPGTPYLEGP